MFNKVFKKRRNKKIVLKKDDHVHHDWVVALIALFIVTLMVVLLSGLIFINISAVEEPDVEVPESTSLLDEDLLRTSLEYYQEKEENYLRYQNTVPIAPAL